MDEHSIFISSLVSTIICSFIALIGSIQISLGVLLGGLMGALVFRLLALDLTTILKSANTDVERQARKGFFKRYLLYAVTIGIGITNPLVSFFGTLFGIMIPRFVILLMVFLRRKKRAI